jgi:hypothetical protein
MLTGVRRHLRAGAKRVGLLLQAKLSSYRRERENGREYRIENEWVEGNVGLLSTCTLSTGRSVISGRR